MFHGTGNTPQRSPPGPLCRFRAPECFRSLDRITERLLSYSMPVRQNPRPTSGLLRNVLMFNRLQYERRRPPLLGLYLMYHDEHILEAVTGTIAQSGIPNSASLGLLDSTARARSRRGSAACREAVLGGVLDGRAMTVSNVPANTGTTPAARELAMAPASRWSNDPTTSNVVGSAVPMPHDPSPSGCVNRITL